MFIILLSHTLSESYCWQLTGTTRGLEPVFIMMAERYDRFWRLYCNLFQVFNTRIWEEMRGFSVYVWQRCRATRRRWKKLDWTAPATKARRDRAQSGISGVAKVSVSPGRRFSDTHFLEHCRLKLQLLSCIIDTGYVKITARIANLLDSWPLAPTIELT